MDALLSTADLAELLRVPESTLRYWRQINEGPKYAKIRGKVRYHPRDVNRWWEQQVKATQR